MSHSSLPIQISAGTAEPHATEAFALLGNETRLAILLAPWEEYDPHAAGISVPFSTLFERVEYDDPGSFSYHLQQLTGQFIRHHPIEGGYELRVPALRFVHVVIAGAGVQDATLEPTAIDQACPFCASATTIRYQDGLVIHACTNCEGVTADGSDDGFLNAVPFDPAGFSERSPAEDRAASRVAAWQQTQFMFDGLCPACSGPVDRRLDCYTDHDQDGIYDRCGARFAVLARFECRTCKNHNVSSPLALVMDHPEVIGFYSDCGVPIRFRANDIESVRRVFDLMGRHGVRPIDDDPPCAEVVVTPGRDEIRSTIDESVNLVNTAR